MVTVAEAPIPQDAYVTKVGETVSYIKNRLPQDFQPYTTITLGSGLGGLANHLEQPIRVSYSNLAHMPQSTVPGHSSELVAGYLSGVPVITFNRHHLYESGDPDMVAFHVHVARGLGSQLHMTTNAAGGLNESFRPGDIMIITDHIGSYLLGGTPLLHHPFPGTRLFPSQTGEYSSELREILKDSVPQAHEGIYIAVPGPQFETAAEVRKYRKDGADAVGMSTVIEILTAHKRGMETLGLSVITNATAADGSNNATHEEVLAVGKKVEEVLIPSLKDFFARLKAVRNL